MPISSFPISVRSSVNLSDINIDTDLDMGANSILGYAQITDLKDLLIVKLSTYPVYYEDYTVSGEHAVNITGSPKSESIGNTTFTFDSSKYNGYPSIISGQVKTTGNLQLRAILSHTPDSETGSLCANYYAPSFPGTDYVDITNYSKLGKYQLPSTSGSPLYITGGSGASVTETITYKDITIRNSYMLKASTNFTLKDLNIKSVILNGGGFSVNGVALGDGISDMTRNLYNLDTISTSDNLQYTGNCLALIEI